MFTTSGPTACCEGLHGIQFLGAELREIIEVVRNRYFRAVTWSCSIISVIECMKLKMCCCR